MLFLYFASAGQSNPFLCPYEESSTLNAAVLLFLTRETWKTWGLRKRSPHVAFSQNSILTSARLAGSASKKSRFERPLLLAIMLDGKATII